MIISSDEITYVHNHDFGKNHGFYLFLRDCACYRFSVDQVLVGLREELHVSMKLLRVNDRSCEGTQCHNPSIDVSVEEGFLYDVTCKPDESSELLLVRIKVAGKFCLYTAMEVWCSEESDI